MQYALYTQRSDKFYREKKYLVAATLQLVTNQAFGMAKCVYE